MKKILFIFHDTDMTGASISLFRIIQGLVELNRYDIHIFMASTQGPIHDLLVQYNIKTYAFDKKKSQNIWGKLLDRIVYFPRYAFTLFQIRPDIVYANTLMNTGEVVIARLMNFYTLVHTHEGKNFIQKYALFVKLADYFTCEYITVSQYALDCLKMSTRQNTKKNIVYNGIKIAQKQVLTELEHIPKRLSVIATIDKNKSQLTAIQALSYLLSSTSLKLQLNFFGKIANREYHKELVDYIHAKNLSSNVVFHGETVNQAKMYDQTDLLLITSKDETFSLTALEAFSSFVPVIASDVGGLPEVVEQNITGLLFETGNYKELSKHIHRLIIDHSLRHQIITNAYQCAVEKFSIDLTVKKIHSILDRILTDAK